MKKYLITFILFGIFLAGFNRTALGTTENNGDIDSLRSALEKWVETKQLISSEKQNWHSQKEILIDRTNLLEGQVRDLGEKIKEAETAIGKTEEKREDLSTRHEKLKEAIFLLQNVIAQLELKTLKLLPRLPEPVQEQVAPLRQEIPKDPEQSKLPLSTRYQNIIGVLNYINKFNNAVTLTTEVRKLDSAKAVEVKVIYLGLGQAYFSNDAATIGGVGRPTDTGWKWEIHDDIATAVSSAIAMYNSEKTADYIALPVEIEN